METIKVQPWDPAQGDFVVINKDDFDPEKHTEYVDQPNSGEVDGTQPTAKKVNLTVDQIKEILASRNIEIPQGAKKDELIALMAQTAEQ